MCPRRTHHARPEHIAEAIRAKRKKVLYGPYNCPKCMEEKLRIAINKKEGDVYATCGCGFQYTLEYRGMLEPVDYYSKMLDRERGRHQ